MASNSQTSEKDIGWQHGYCKDPKNKVSVTCKYCGRDAKGGIYRLKQHLVGGFRNITGCTKVPEHVKEEVTQFMVKKKTLKDQITDLPELDDIDMNPEEKNECDNVVDPRDVRSKVSKRAQGGSARGSMHSYFQPASASEKGKAVNVKQTTINNHYKKELREKACADIARWMYDAAIPLNAVNHDSFKDVIESIGRYGIGMKAPSYHEVRVPLLKEDVQKTDAALKSHREEWTKTGCSIMSDGWTDRNHRSIINFLVNCAKGSMFLESVDASAYSQTAERKAELLSRIIEKVGPSNVVQIITDNDSSYKLAGTMLEAKYPHIYWTPCAAHCIDLILEDIGKLPNIAKTIKRAVEVCGFIYNRVGLVNMLRKFTNQKNLIRPAKTRFATSFLTLKSINNQRANLRKMFTSQEWTSSKWVKEQGGKRISSTILMPTFWSTVVYTLKVTAPLVDVLRLVDGEIKPAMGYIYEAMDRAKERIAAHFNGKESKYEEVYEIIDKRWNCQLHRPLHAAGYFLNPEFFYANSESIEQDEEVMNGLYNCLARLVPDTDVQDQISNEITMYRNAYGLFGTDLAKRHRTKRAPADWWSAYGASTPSLQRFAIKILSLTCSSSGCERNWSVFEQVRFLARSFAIPGNHLGQQSHGFRWPYGPVVIVTPFNFPLEIPVLQLMGALYMGNKPLLKVDSKVSIVMDQMLRLLHHCGLPKEDVDFINSDGKTMNKLLLEANPRMTLFTGSSRVAEKLALDLKGRVKLEDAGFDWKILGPDVQEVDYIAWVCDQDAYACSGQKCSAQSILFMHENWSSTPLISKMKSLAERRKLEDLTIGPVLTVTTETMLEHMNNLLKISGSKLLFGGETLENHSIPNIYGAIKPTAVYVPLEEILKEDNFELVTKEIFGPFQVVTEYKQNQLPEVLDALERMHAHLTAAVVSNDLHFLQEVIGKSVNGTTYAGMRARTTGAPQNHWFGPAGDPRGAGIGTPEAIKLVWSCHREIIYDVGPVPKNWEIPPST